MLQTDKSSVGGKKTTNKNPQKTWAISILSSPNHSRQYHMGSGGISRLSKKQYHMGSKGISRLFERLFGLFCVNSSIKRDS